MSSKFKVHFLGGEGINWALDHDILHLTNLSEDFVEVTSIEKADIIHSVYWGALLTVPEKYLQSKIVIASIADKPQIVFSRPEYLKVRNKIDVWLCEYYESLHFVSNCGLPCMLFPDAIDVDQFSAPTDRQASVSSLKAKYGIADDCYLIGNFHRDSLGGNLQRPKKQKGADVFLEVADQLNKRGLPVHFLLAGPRRHWLRNHMKECGIPYTYVGEEIDRDDIDVNTLNLDQIAELYRGLDAYIIASRWEGAPNSVLECSSTKTPVISTHVGQSPDILANEQIYYHAVKGADLIANDIESGWLGAKTEAAYDHIHKWNTYDAIAERLKYIYQQATRCYGKRNLTNAYSPQSKGLFGFRKKKIIAEGDKEERKALIHKRTKGKSSYTFALWNDFRPPPYGGGNQFMIALEKALQRKGMKTQRNTGAGADAHVFQSIWFDRKQFEAECEPDSVVIHRVDGPIQLYRGNDFKSDAECYEINAALADVTVMQSSWSMDQTYNLGFKPKKPVLMWNSCDPDIFGRKEKIQEVKNRKVRLISTSWSDNPRKGKDTYKWLDENLDWDRYEYIFVGRINEAFQNIQVIEPVGSEELADLIREHDIYVTASQKDPCSNALVEALNCGLPALYYDDGGHPELAGFGGLGFHAKEEITEKLKLLSENLSAFANPIWVDHIDDLAQKYIDVVRDCHLY